MRVLPLLFLASLPFFALLSHTTLGLGGGVLLFHLCFFGEYRAIKGAHGYLFLSLFLLTLSGAVLPIARNASLAAALLSSFFVAATHPALSFTAVRRTLCPLGALLGAWAILEIALGGGHEGFADIGRFERLARAAAVFDNPNVLAAFLCPIVPLALSGVMEEKGRRLLFLFFLLLTLGGLAATFSRGAWVAVAVSGLCYAILQKKSLLPLWGGLALSPGLLLFAPQSIRLRLYSLLSPDSSMGYRLSLWRSVLRLPPLSLTVGGGEGHAALTALLSPTAAAGLEAVEHTHSLYLHFLTASGVLGLAFFLLLCLLSLTRPVPLGLRAALLCTYIFGLFDDPLYSAPVALLFWLLLGMTASTDATKSMKGAPYAHKTNTP